MDCWIGLTYRNLYSMVCSMDSINYTELRRQLAAALDQVNEDRAPLYITRQRGKPAVLLAAEDYAAMEETIYLMSSVRNAERLTAAIEGLRRGHFEQQHLIE